MKALYCLLIFVTISHLSFAQVIQLSPDQNPGKGTIEEFDWLVGYWVGTGLDGDCEEVWMPAIDGQMIGTFRFWENGKLVFSEFMNLVSEGESISMKLKHFGKDLKGWEEKDEWTTFQLIEMGDQKAFLNGMTIERKGDLLIFQVNISNQGETQIETFTYTKKSL